MRWLILLAFTTSLIEASCQENPIPKKLIGSWEFVSQDWIGKSAFDNLDFADIMEIPPSERGDGPASSEESNPEEAYEPVKIRLQFTSSGYFQSNTTNYPDKYLLKGDTLWLGACDRSGGQTIKELSAITLVLEEVEGPMTIGSRSVQTFQRVVDNIVKPINESLARELIGEWNETERWEFSYDGKLMLGMKFSLKDSVKQSQPNLTITFDEKQGKAQPKRPRHGC